MAVIKKLDENVHPSIDSQVRLKLMGNISEVRYMRVEPIMKIRKLTRDEYVDLDTGEIKKFNHAEKRVDNLVTVRQTLRRLNEIINTNVTDATKCLWVTLTYAENMQDPKRLYDDFRKFNQRLKRYLKSNNLPNHEYLVAVEPQARGALHAHLLVLFSEKAPFIKNEVLRELWRQGFVNIQKLKDVDNIGAYLTAYLADMDFTELENTSDLAKAKFKVVEEINSEGIRKEKAIVKGARMKMYPAGFKIYRKSKGIIAPTIIDCTEKEAMKIVGAAPLAFEKTITIDAENGSYFNTINYRQFNKAKKHE